MDYDELLQIKVNYPRKIIILTIILLIIGFYVINLKVSDTYNYYGYAKDNILYINVPVLYSDTIINGTTLYIDKVKYSYEIIHVGSLEIDNINNINYQVIAIKINKQFTDNQVVKITTYSNEEKIIKKLLKIE